LELLDPGASKAFAVADHQVAHIYINDPSVTGKVRALLENTPGVASVLDKTQQVALHIDHERSGDFVAVAGAHSWFTYYFWLDDALAPDYARVVDIHKKPGYDPVELFMTSKLRAGYKLLRKKAGFRYVMDVIPLDAGLVKGSHGAIPASPEYFPLLISDRAPGKETLEAVEVFDMIWRELTGFWP
jgi:predicted AlkP superfamily pyrophosphatase or phosphodiesterase